MNPTTQHLIQKLSSDDCAEADILPLLDDPDLHANATDQHGRSLLLLACIRGFSQLTQQLIARGANINQGNLGLSPLFLACTHRHTNIVWLLAQAGASWNTPDQNGQTPLYCYALYSNIHNDALDDLVFGPSSDFNPNHRDRDGRTPLDYYNTNSADLSPSLWRMVKSGMRIDPTSHLIHETPLGLYYQQALTCWQSFEANPNIITLTDQDLRFFANVGHLADAFATDEWRNHPDHLRTLVASLPLYLQNELLEQQPGLIPILDATPHTSITQWSIEQAQRREASR